MFMNLFIVIVAAAILVGCIVAIVMSTSHGTAWLQSLWQGGRDEDDDRGGPAA